MIFNSFSFEAAYLSERIIMLKGEGAKTILDEAVPLPLPRTEELRTSEQLNSVVRKLSEGFKS